MRIFQVRVSVLLVAMFFYFGRTYVLQAQEAPEYGEIYLKETKALVAPRFHFGIGYATDIANSFLSLNSVCGTAEARVWRYFSTGVFAQFVRAELSSAGTDLRALQNTNVTVKIPEPRWGIFSISHLQFIVGEWNVINLVPLRVDLLIGGGAGVIQRRDDTDAPSHSKISYLWSVEQRMLFYKNYGLFFSVFGHSFGNFMQAGLHYDF